jgi:DNA segregation ATPase FtsK/SpoIIIE-like protein
MAGELAKMLADLVEALGGEATMDAPGEQKSAPAPSQQKVERAIRLTAEMYKVRDMHRAVLDTLYQQTLKPYIDTIREAMRETGADEIETALALAKQHTGGTQTAQMFLVAAIEIVEPTGPTEPAKGDEPVRQQRVVGDDGTALAAARKLNESLKAAGATMTVSTGSKSVTVGATDDVPAGDGSASDPLYEQAVAVVRTNQRASISLVQRHLRIGYNRAARLLEAIEASGIVTMEANKGTPGLSPA